MSHLWLNIKATVAVILVAIEGDSLVLCTTRSWTDQVRTTQTLSQPPTLDFVKPSRQTRQHTPLCSPEHSRTKRSTCTGSRRNARKAARALQRPAWLNSKRRNPVHQGTEKRETEGEGGEEDEIEAPNPHCSSASCQHRAQLWSCLLFYKHMALWTILLEQWAVSDLGLHCFC